MRYIIDGRTREEAIHRLVGAAQGQGPISRTGAGKNLKAAKAPNVIKSTPILDICRRRHSGNGFGKRRHSVDDHFWITCSSGSQQHPLRREVIVSPRGARLQGKFAWDNERNVATQLWRPPAVVDDGIDFGVTNDGAEVPRFKIRRTDDDTAHPSIKVDQRGRDTQLIVSNYHYRSTFQFVDMSAQTRCVSKTTER